MKWVRVILWVALVSLVWAMITRVTPLWGFPVGITPSAFLRLTNTLVLFAIAISLVVKFSKHD